MGFSEISFLRSSKMHVFNFFLCLHTTQIIVQKLFLCLYFHIFNSVAKNLFLGRKKYCRVIFPTCNPSPIPRPKTMPMVVHIAYTNFKGLRKIQYSKPVISQGRSNLLLRWKDSVGLQFHTAVHFLMVRAHTVGLTYNFMSYTSGKWTYCDSRFSQIVCMYYSANMTTGFHNRNVERKFKMDHKRNICKGNPSRKLVSSQSI